MKTLRWGSAGDREDITALWTLERDATTATSTNSSGACCWNRASLRLHRFRSALKGKEYQPSGLKLLCLLPFVTPVLKGMEYKPFGFILLCLLPFVEPAWELPFVNSAWVLLCPKPGFSELFCWIRHELGLDALFLCWISGSLSSEIVVKLILVG